MQVDFNDFDIDCSDYLEIRNNLPGQPGVRLVKKLEKVVK